MKEQRAAIQDSETPRQLAIEGGRPVRTEPLPLEFSGIHHMGEDEVKAAVGLLESRSLFRYYGIELQKEVEHFDDPDLSLWGKGYRLDELRAALLRVQLKKLPSIIASMRASKYRIRQALAEVPTVRLRKIVDPEGDTGCFLITTYPDQRRRHA